MSKNEHKIIYFPHRPGLIGGPSSFQFRLECMLREKGYSVMYADDKLKKNSSVIIVVGGTKKFFWLFKAKIKGIKIIQRLDGIDTYEFRFKDGIKNFIKSRLIHFIIKFIRKRLANHIIYQSLYVKKVWEDRVGRFQNQSVIYNAVNLNEFYPIEKNSKKTDLSLVSVEGTVQGELAINILKSISVASIDVYGQIHKKILNDINKLNNKKIILHGPVPRNEIYKVFKGRKIYICLEIKPACPNSVIEALAAGVPVVGFDSGSLKELVGQAGIILPYDGGSQDRMESPSCMNIDSAIVKINENYEYYSNLAKSRAEKFFDLNDQYTKYSELIENYIH